MRARPATPRHLPCALAISGLDPSGGAGLLADVRAFAAANVWGCAAIAVSTVQSTAGMRRSHPLPSRELLDQVREIYAHQNVRSIKIGALGSLANVRAILRWLGTVSRDIPVVLDPVMVPTRGAKRARLLDHEATNALGQLAARVTLVTPNVSEAELLTGTTIRSIEDAERAARVLVEAGAHAALVKGGHLRNRAIAGKTTDVLVIGSRTLHFSAPRVAASVHGTGCTLASLIAGKLAGRGPDRAGDDTIIDSVRWAKSALRRALARPARIGTGQLVLPV